MADELWILERPGPESEERPEEPGSGSLLGRTARSEKEIPLPLKHTSVKADIAGSLATVEVRQEFHNPFNEKIEAVYVFPLPHDAAIDCFLMVIGQRKIRGIIREREEAIRLYYQARRLGYVASLLTQQRPNVFSQKVANIEPGHSIDIHISYYHTLAYVDGYYEFVFPLVVGPRFNPPGTTEGIGAVARGVQGLSG